MTEISGYEPDGHRRYVTEESTEHPERFHLLRLCACPSCDGTGRVKRRYYTGQNTGRCPSCRGEGRTRDLVATCATPEAVGVALVTLGREGEWNECPIGVLDTLPPCPNCEMDGWLDDPLPGCPSCAGTGIKQSGTWLVRPWLPSARNVSDAAKLLRAQQT